MEEGRGEGEMEGSHTDGALETLVYLSRGRSLIFPSSHRLISLISSHPPKRGYPRPSASGGQAWWWVIAPAAGTHKDPEADVDYV